MKVFIVGGSMAYANMFQREEGYEVVNTAEEADLIQFTGGEDVTPTIYGEVPHPASHFNIQRDKQEAAIFNQYVGKTPMLGICRGGQFLNVMNGGSLHQHVQNHSIGGTHECFSGVLEETVQVTSTHHQMMVAGDAGLIEGYVPRSRSPVKEGTDKDGRIVYITDEVHDTEVVWYEDSQCLCFQPHPELFGADSTREYYFALLKNYFG